MEHKEHIERLVKKGGFDLTIVGINKYSKCNFIGKIDGRNYSCSIYDIKGNVELRKHTFYADQERKALEGELNYVIL